MNLAVAAAILGAARDAWPRPSGAVRACLDAHGNAQEYRRRDDLLAARDELRVCAATSCPGVVQADCNKWLDEVVEAIPSIVLGAKVDDESVLDVSVTMDGIPLESRLDGKPLDVNPGLHSFTFERRGSPLIEKKAIVAAREKSQMISVTWKSGFRERTRIDTSPPPPPLAAAKERPVPPVVYFLGASAFAGLGAFAVLGLTARSTEQSLESSCAPSCAQGDVNDLRTRFLAADIAAGVGALSAAGALLVFVTRPERDVPRPAAPASIGIGGTAGGATLQWRGTF